MTRGAQTRARSGGPRCVVHPTNVNDRSAGLPTETLLRLLLPLDNQVTDVRSLYFVSVCFVWLHYFIHSCDKIKNLITICSLKIY